MAEARPSRRDGAVPHWGLLVLLLAWELVGRMRWVGDGALPAPTEVLARAVGQRAVSAGNASTLVELFTEARFSRHVMTEGHRDVAEQALRSVLGELRGRR